MKAMRFTIVLWPILFSSSLALATTVRTLHLGEMVALAGRVFQGRCVAVERDAGGVLGVPVYRYQFEVLEGVKGTRPGERVEIRQAALPGAPGLPGLPRYRVGQELILFLHVESRVGLTSPVGLGQGVFQVFRQEGKPMAINGMTNLNLASGVFREQAGLLGLAPSLLDTFSRSQGGPVPVESLLQAVRAIERSQDGNRTRLR